MENQKKPESSPPPSPPSADVPSAPAGVPASLPPHTPLWTNFITLAGLLCVGIGMVLFLTFWLFQLLSSSSRDNQYLNVVGFMILPGILTMGLVLCPIGILLRKRRLRHGPVWFVSTRHALIFLAVSFFLILPVLGVGGYQGYQYTESAEFCGTVCHNMNPQWTRYEQSPHERVTCAGCHVGPGAPSFVKAKLAGLRQVYFTLTNNVPRPVPPAITELRPARETCEQCHWPFQFFGSVLKKIIHYAPDEKNTRHDYDILIRVGGVNNALGKSEGIHMHMLDRVDYVADDPRLDHISWVRYTYPDGQTVVFRSDGKTSHDPAPQGNMRRLDCIDCHNYAGHDFNSPNKAVNHALSVGWLDVNFPYIKREAVRALSDNYTSKPQALAGIAQTLENFYQTSYPDIWKSNRDQLAKNVAAVQDIYKANFFPEYKVDWRTYPSHVGHMESAGCFRCHDGLHVADDGRAIVSTCATCHTFLYRQEKPGMIREQAFDHMAKINDYWNATENGTGGPHQKLLCSDCHDGAMGTIGYQDPSLGNACGDCHKEGRWEKIRETVKERRAAASQPWTKDH